MSAQAQETVDSIGLGLNGDASPLAKALTDGLNFIDKFVAGVSARANKLNTALKTPFAAMDGNAQKLDASLGKVNATLDTTSRKAAGVAAPLGEAAVSLKEVAGAADDASRKTSNAGRSFERLETRTTASMAGVDAAVKTGVTALVTLTETVNAAREAAGKPIRLKVDASDVDDAKRKVSSNTGGNGLSQMASGANTVGGDMIRGGMEMAAPVVASTAAYVKMNRILDDVRGNTTLTDTEMNRLKDDIKTLAAETDQPLEQIANGFMVAANYDYKGADGLKVLRAANMAAVASGTDLNDVVGALAGTMHQFGAPVEDASRVMNVLSYVAGATNQHLSDFVKNAGRGFEAAATLKIGLADAATVMGVLTKNQLSAAQSQTAFRSIVKGIIQPTKEAREEIKALSDKTGIDLVGAFSAAGLAHYGLVNVLEMTKEATHGEADELKKVFTDGRSFVPVLDELTKSHGILVDTLKGAKKAFIENQRIQQQYAEQSQDVDFRLGKLRNTVVLAAADFGEKFAPQIAKAIDWVKSIIQWLDNLSPSAKEAMMNTLAIGAALLIVGGGVLKFTGLILGLVNGFRSLLMMREVVTVIGTLTTAMEGATVAAEGAAAAETGVATAGIAAFAAGGPLSLALLAITAVIGGIAFAWWKVHQAEEDAAQAAQDYANAQAKSAAIGPRHALSVQLGNVDQQRSDVRTEMDNIDNQIKELPSAQSRVSQGGGNQDDSVPGVNPGMDMAASERGQKIVELLAKKKQLGEQAAALDKQSKALRAQYEKMPKELSPVKTGGQPGDGSLPLYLLGGGRPIPTENPDAGKKNKASAGYKADITPPRFDDLEPLSTYFSTSELMTQVTNAANYDAQKTELADRAAKRKLEIAKGAPLSENDQYQEDRMRLGYAKNLADAAVTNTDKAVNDPKTGLRYKEAADVEAEKAAYAAVLAQAHAINAAKAAGQKLTQADNAEYAKLLASYKAAKRLVDDDVKAIKENARVKRQATEDGTRAYNGLTELENRRSANGRQQSLDAIKEKFGTGASTRDEMDAALQDEIARAGGETAEAAKAFVKALSESKVARANLNKDLHQKVLGLDGKDFDARREAVTDEAANMRRNGAKEETVADFTDKSNKKIGNDEWEKTFHDKNEDFKRDLEDGKSKLEDYKAFLDGAMTEAVGKFSSGSTQVKELRRELEHTGWAIADQEAEKFRQSLDSGDLSLQQYIARLEQLRQTVGENNAEYDKLTRQIDAANRKMIADARATGDRIGTEFGQGIVRALRRQSSFVGVVRDMFNKAVDEAAAGAIKRMVSNLVFKFLNKGDQGKVAAEEKQIRAAGVQNTAADKELKAAGLQKEASENQLKAAQLNQQTNQTAPKGDGTGGPTGGDGASGDALKGLGKDWATAAIEKYSNGSVDGSDVSNAENVYSISQGEGGRASIPGADGNTNMLASLGMNAAGTGALGAGAAAAVPWVAGALAVTSLVMGFMNKPQKPDFDTKSGEGKFSFLGNGDHTGLIDSGLSGVEGMRKLQAARDSRNAQGAAAGRSVQVSNTLHPGAITVVMQPGQDHMAVAKAVMQEFTAQTAFEDSLNGTG